MLDTGNANNNAIQLAHEAYRDGKVGSNNKQETRDAVRAHTEMAAKMQADGQKLDFDGSLKSDLLIYALAQQSGDMSVMDKYADMAYDSDNDNFAFFEPLAEMMINKFAPEEVKRDYERLKAEKQKNRKKMPKITMDKTLKIR